MELSFLLENKKQIRSKFQAKFVIHMQLWLGSFVIDVKGMLQRSCACIGQHLTKTITTISMTAQVSMLLCFASIN